MKRPAFQFYPGDYLSDMAVSLMTAEEEGHYIRLLCYCWLEGSLPNDDVQLAKLLKLNGGSCLVPTVVKGRFTVVPNDPSKLVHKRLEKERQKQDEWAEKSRIGGLKSGQIRKNKGVNRSNGGSQMVEPPYEPKGNSSSSSSSSYKYINTLSEKSDERRAVSSNSSGGKETKTPGENQKELLDQSFETIWKIYPRRDGGKADTRQLYERVVRKTMKGLMRPQCVLICRRIDQQIEAWELEKRELKHIPMLRTYLGQQRFDEPPEALVSDQPEERS